jgi:hypothetical protein
MQTLETGTSAVRVECDERFRTPEYMSCTETGCVAFVRAARPRSGRHACVTIDAGALDTPRIDADDAVFGVVTVRKETVTVAGAVNIVNNGWRALRVGDVIEATFDAIPAHSWREAKISRLKSNNATFRVGRVLSDSTRSFSSLVLLSPPQPLLFHKLTSIAHPPVAPAAPPAAHVPPPPAPAAHPVHVAPPPVAPVPAPAPAVPPAVHVHPAAPVPPPPAVPALPPAPPAPVAPLVAPLVQPAALPALPPVAHAALPAPVAPLVHANPAAPVFGPLVNAAPLVAGLPQQPNPGVMQQPIIAAVSTGGAPAPVPNAARKVVRYFDVTPGGLAALPPLEALATTPLPVGAGPTDWPAINKNTAIDILAKFGFDRQDNTAIVQSKDYIRELVNNLRTTQVHMAKGVYTLALRVLGLDENGDPYVEPPKIAPLPVAPAPNLPPAVVAVPVQAAPVVVLPQPVVVQQPVAQRIRLDQGGINALSKIEEIASISDAEATVRGWEHSREFARLIIGWFKYDANEQTVEFVAVDTLNAFIKWAKSLNKHMAFMCESALRVLQRDINGDPLPVMPPGNAAAPSPPASSPPMLTPISSPKAMSLPASPVLTSPRTGGSHLATPPPASPPPPPPALPVVTPPQAAVSHLAVSLPASPVLTPSPPPPALPALRVLTQAGIDAIRRLEKQARAIIRPAVKPNSAPVLAKKIAEDVLTEFKFDAANNTIREPTDELINKLREGLAAKTTVLVRETYKNALGVLGIGVGADEPASVAAVPMVVSAAPEPPQPVAPSKLLSAENAAAAMVPHVPSGLLVPARDAQPPVAAPLSPSKPVLAMSTLTSAVSSAFSGVGSAIAAGLFGGTPRPAPATTSMSRNDAINMFELIRPYSIVRREVISLITKDTDDTDGALQKALETAPDGDALCIQIAALMKNERAGGMKDLGEEWMDKTPPIRRKREYNEALSKTPAVFRRRGYLDADPSPDAIARLCAVLTQQDYNELTEMVQWFPKSFSRESVVRPLLEYIVELDQHAALTKMYMGAATEIRKKYGHEVRETDDEISMLMLLPPKEANAMISGIKNLLQRAREKDCGAMLGQWAVITADFEKGFQDIYKLVPGILDRTYTVSVVKYSSAHWNHALSLIPPSAFTALKTRLKTDFDALVRTQKLRRTLYSVDTVARLLPNDASRYVQRNLTTAVESIDRGIAEGACTNLMPRDAYVVRKLPAAYHSSFTSAILARVDVEWYQKYLEHMLDAISVPPPFANPDPRVLINNVVDGIMKVFPDIAREHFVRTCAPDWLNEATQITRWHMRAAVTVISGLERKDLLTGFDEASRLASVLQGDIKLDAVAALIDQMKSMLPEYVPAATCSPAMFCWLWWRVRNDAARTKCIEPLIRELRRQRKTAENIAEDLISFVKDATRVIEALRPEIHDAFRAHVTAAVAMDDKKYALTHLLWVVPRSVFNKLGNDVKAISEFL